MSNLNTGRLTVYINSNSSIIQACALQEWHETSMSKAAGHGAYGRLPLDMYNSAQTPCLDICKDFAPSYTHEWSTSPDQAHKLPHCNKIPFPTLFFLCLIFLICLVGVMILFPQEHATRMGRNEHTLKGWGQKQCLAQKPPNKAQSPLRL